MKDILAIGGFVLVGLFCASIAQAQVSLGFPASFAGFSSQDLKTTIENMIRIIVGFIGYIAILVIFIGGMKWMLSGGNEDRIADAKKLISAGIVGIIIVLTAFSIAKTVVESLQQAV